MVEISETEIKSMTKEQNYLRGYADCKKDMSSKNLIEIPENATIGDVIKAVFPDWKIEHIRKMSGLDRYDINIDNFNRFSVYEDLWNSPYQPKEKKSATVAKFHDFYLEDQETWPPADEEILIKNCVGDNFLAYLVFDDGVDGGWGFYSEDGDPIADLDEIDAWMPIPQHERNKNYIPKRRTKDLTIDAPEEEKDMG